MVYTLLFNQHKLTLMRRDRNKGRNDWVVRSQETYRDGQWKLEL